MGVAEGKVEDAPDAGDIAAHRGIHETGKERHGPDMKDAMFWINP